MRVIKGKKGFKHSWQDEFAESIRCSCGGEGQIAFVAIEDGAKEKFICDCRPEDAKLWPHDAIAVAVYICKKCMKTTSEMNQA